MKIFFFLLSLFSYQAHAENLILGAPENIGNGEALSFVRIDESQKITSLGLVFSGKCLEGLPQSRGHDYEYNLDLPDGVTAAPFDHFTMNWNPQGHIPDEIYGVPHFDFHFYFITKHQQHLIACDGTDDAICMKAPIRDYVPPFYIAGPSGVPMMGWHWVDLRSPEFGGKPFTTTYIYGYYNGEMIFLEPMMALSFLKNHPQFAKDVPLPRHVARAGNYPGGYSMVYDPVQDLYWLSLEKLTPLINKQ